MIELTEEPYDGEAMTALAVALNLEINERYDDGSPSDDDANYRAEVTPELVARPIGTCVVARIEGKPVGCGAVKPMKDQPGRITPYGFSKDSPLSVCFAKDLPAP